MYMVPLSYALMETLSFITYGPRFQFISALSIFTNVKITEIIGIEKEKLNLSEMAFGFHQTGNTRK